MDTLSSKYHQDIINIGGGEQHSFDIVNENGCPKQRHDYLPSIIIDAGNVKMQDSLGGHNVVFPLVALESATIPQSRDFVRTYEDNPEQAVVEGVYVTSSSFSLIDTSLPLGTGPLLNFGSIYGQTSCPSSPLIETSLIHTRLLNVTSSPSPDRSRQYSTDQRQSMIGVEVRGCTNHLYGTACKNMNTGGSVLCQNSSFSRCSTSLEPSSTHPTYTLQHHTGEQALSITATSDSSTIVITRCTFHTISSESIGGAVQLLSTDAPVTVAECSFVDCTVDIMSGSGGSVMSSFFSNCYVTLGGHAVPLSSNPTCTISSNVFLVTPSGIHSGSMLSLSPSETDFQLSHNMFLHHTSSGILYLFYLSNSITPVHIAFCAFESPNKNKGGCFIERAQNSVTITHCEYVKCTASNGGGILFARCTGLLKVEDSLFDRCDGTRAGGIHIDPSQTFSFQRLKFKECTASSGNDVSISRLSVADVESGNMIGDCVTTSLSMSVYFTHDPNGRYSSSSGIVPKFASITVPEHTIELTMCVDEDDVRGTLTVTASGNVEGRMLVVVDNSLSDYEKPNVDSPPPIARLFVFDFSTPSTTSSQPILFNEWNTLQYESQYSISSAFLSGANITNSFSSQLETPNPPRIVEVLMGWSESEPDKITFQVKGRHLTEGNYIVKVKEVSDLSIHVSFTGHPTNPSESRNMHSSTVGVLLFGLGSKLTFDTEYEIASVMKDGDSSPLILDPPRLFFATPTVRAVLDISCALSTNFTHFVVTFTGQELPLSGTYTARLESSSFSFDVTLSDGVGTSEPIEGNATNGLLFGTEYTLSSLASEGDLILLSKTSFSTPAGPTLSNVLCSPDALDLSFAILTLSGLRMPSSSDYKLTVVEDGGSTEVTLNVSFTSSTDGSVRVEVYKKENTLKYGCSYSVSSLLLGSLSISLPSKSITFVLTNPPRLTGVGEPIINHTVDQSTISMSLFGGNIPTGSYEMNMSLVGDGPSEEITLNASFSSKESGKVTAVVFDADKGGVDLLFGTEYSIVSLWSEDDSIWIPSSLSIVVPSSPGIVESFLLATLNDAKTIMTLTLCGTDFVSGPTHVILLDGSNEVRSNGDVAVINKTHFTVTFAAGWTQSSSTVAYSKSYSVKSVSSSSSKSFLVRSSIVVKIPKALCVTEISCNLDTCLTHFDVTFTGQDLPLSGTYTAHLSPTGSFDVTFSEGVGKSGLIEGNGTNGLLFNTAYTLLSLASDGDLILLNKTSFSTPAGPTLSDVVCSPDALDLSYVVLTLSGSRMPSSTKYELIVTDSEDSTQLTLDVSFTSSNEGSGRVEVYKIKNSLKYERSYSVVSLFLDSLSISIPDLITFDTPSAPTRVEDADAALNDIRTEAIVELSGMSFVDGVWMVTIPTTPPQVIRGELSENGKIVCSVEADETDQTKLIFGSTYKVSSVTLNGNEVIVNDDVLFTVPHAPHVSSASFSFVNRQHTSCNLSFEGTDLVLGEYNVTLEPPFWVVVSFSSESLGTTGEMKIGWADSIRYSQTYKIQSIIRTDHVKDVIQFDSDIVITTEPKPDSIVIFVNSSGSSSPFCGDSSLPCSSMDLGFSIVNGIGFTHSEMKIVESASQTSQHSMSSGSIVSISASSTVSAMLEVSPSGWEGWDGGMFVVQKSRLEFHEISVVVEVLDELFVLVSGENSTLIMKNTSFSGMSPPPSSVLAGNTLSSSSSLFSSPKAENSDSICSWSTGLFVLWNCSTTVTSSQLHDLPQGALNMKHGTLTLRESSFDGNSPNLRSFPSARRNIRCTEGGNVTIGSLNGGDGSTDKHPHLWLSPGDCVLSGEDVNINAPFFVPTLSSDSTCTWDKKEKQFDVTILGTTLIPCGLFLEVFEVGKDRAEGKSLPIELTQQSTTSFTETNITFAITATSLSKLDSSTEWRGRLIFGSNQKTTNSFQIQRDSSGRLSQTVKENMKWWLPLVIVLSVAALFIIALLIFLLRRRRQKENVKTQKLADSTELDVGVEEMKIEDMSHATTDLVHDKSYCSTTQMGSIITKERDPNISVKSEENWDGKKDEVAMACGVDGKEVKVMNKYDTLFNRLHHPQPGLEIDKNAVRKQILSALQSISGSGRNEFILKQLSPHEIFFDLAGVVGLNMKQHPHQEQGEAQKEFGGEHVREHELQTEQTSNYQETLRSGRIMHSVSMEGDRWKAPEVMMGKKGVRSESAAVFSFGLILWELETRQVPFPELDALNAHRQLKAGQPLPMDVIESPELVEIITQCLDVDPANRPSLSDLEKFLNPPSLHQPSQPLALNPTPFVATFQLP